MMNKKNGRQSRFSSPKIFFFLSSKFSIFCGRNFLFFVISNFFFCFQEERKKKKRNMGGKEEGKAAREILNKSDKSLLTWKEIHEGWDSCHNFFMSYGLKVWDKEDCEEARAISRSLKKQELGTTLVGVCYEPSVLIKDFNALKEEITCPICFEKIKSPFETSCCHKLVCSSCKNKRARGSCPLCRKQGFSCVQNIPAREMINKVTALLNSVDPVFVEATKRKKKEEEKKKKREEAEKKRKEEEKRKKEQERRKREQEKKIRERGSYFLSWLPKDDLSIIQRNTTVADIKCFSFLNDGFILVDDDGDCIHTGLPDGRLNSLINGRGRGLTNEIDLLSVVETADGYLYYYILFRDGKRYWDIPEESDLNGFLQEYSSSEVKKISLGLSLDGDLQYAVEATDGYFEYEVEGVHESWLGGGWVECWLGSCGEYFVRLGDGNFIHSYLPTNKLREMERPRNRVKRAFIANGDLLMTYS